MTIEKITTTTLGDYLILDTDTGVYSLSQGVVLDAREALRRVHATVEPDRNVAIDRSQPGRREEPGKDAIPIGEISASGDGEHFLARPVGRQTDLVLTAGEVAAIFDAFDLR